MVFMDMESHNIGLRPYNFEPEYSVEEIDSINIQSTIPTKPWKYFYTPFLYDQPFFRTAQPTQNIVFFLFNSTCVKNILVQEFCLSSIILEPASLASAILYCASGKIRIVIFQPSVQINYWLFKNIEMLELFCYIYQQGGQAIF